jgi:hypothetical protein
LVLDAVGSIAKVAWAGVKYANANEQDAPPLEV